jgi:beta-lactam-binding protein with PASTA domain
MTAVRVYRQVTVAVPDVLGASPSDAAAQLTSRGLRPQTKSSGSGFDFLIPLSVQVCATDPAPETQVAPGATVQLLTGKVC